MDIKKRPFDNGLIYFTYLSYLVSAVLGYFANYQQLLLNADQRQYVVTAYYQRANILRLLIQMAVLYRTANPYYWVAIEMAFAVVYSLILNKRINQAYADECPERKVIVESLSGIDQIHQTNLRTLDRSHSICLTSLRFSFTPIPHWQ